MDLAFFLLEVSCEGEEAADDVRDPVAVLQDSGGQFSAGALPGELIDQYLRVINDAVYRVVYLVGHPCRQLPERSQVRRLHSFRLKCCLFGDIDGNGDDVSHLPAVISDRYGPHIPEFSVGS